MAARPLLAARRANQASALPIHARSPPSVRLRATQQQAGTETAQLSQAEQAPQSEAVAQQRSAGPASTSAPESPTPTGARVGSTRSSQAVARAPTQAVARLRHSFRTVAAKSADQVMDKLTAVGLGVALISMVLFGSDMLSALARFTSIPLEEVDGIAYFLAAFSLISAVVPSELADGAEDVLRK